MNSKNVVRLILAAALAAGVLVRGLSGLSILSATMVYSSEKKEPYPGLRSPEAVVKSFYRFADEGKFDKAWEISREPQWLKEGTRVIYTDEIMAPEEGGFYGFTSVENFVKRYRMELGYGGSWIKLSNIKTRLNTSPAIAPHPEVLRALNPEKLYQVEVKGHLIGACTIFSWEKAVIVAEKGGDFYALLPGTKQAKAFYYQAWFDSIEKIASLRSTP